MFALMYQMPVGVSGCQVPVVFTTYKAEAETMVKELTTFDPEWHNEGWIAPIITIEEVDDDPQEEGNEEYEALKGL